MIQKQEQEPLDEAVNLYFSGEFANAIKLFKKVLLINSTNQTATEYLNRAMENRIIEKELKAIPRDALMYYYRAREYIAANEIGTAIVNLETAIDIAHKAVIRFFDAEQMLLLLKNNPIQAPKSKVFISYSRKHDLEVAKEIYTFIRDCGGTPWMDIYDLIPGQDWELEVVQNIRSSDFFVACLSRHSVSNRGYLQKELKEAISVLEQMPEGEIYLVPIRIDDCIVPHSLTGRQWLDWSAPNAKEVLLKAVNSKKK